MIGMKAKRRLANGAIYVILTVMSVIWLFPIFWLILSALRVEKGSFLKYFFPKGFTFDNFIRLFTETELFNFPRWFTNTLVVAVFSCIITTLFTLMVSFALSRMRFKLRKPYMNTVLVLGLFPGFMSMIAIYYLFKTIGMDQSLLALVLAYSMSAGMTYYIVKGFFDTMPKAIDEAARIDGASYNTIFFKMTLPLSKPIIIYTVMMAFLAPWLDYILVSVIMKDNYNNYTVALGLFKMIDKENIYQYFTQFCAAAVCVAIPITALFIALQKYYIQGITGGAAKG